jgi:hypothetical protein
MAQTGQPIGSLETSSEEYGIGDAWTDIWDDVWADVWYAPDITEPGGVPTVTGGPVEDEERRRHALRIRIRRRGG